MKRRALYQHLDNIIPGLPALETSKYNALRKHEDSDEFDSAFPVQTMMPRRRLETLINTITRDSLDQKKAEADLLKDSIDNFDASALYTQPD